jgi:hypothetical protein
MLREGERVAIGRPSDLVRPLEARVVTLAGVDAGRAIRALGGSDLVASMTQLGDTVHVLLAPAAPPDVSDRLVAALGAAGVAGARVEPASPNLEDVFVALLLGERLGTGAGS